MKISMYQASVPVYIRALGNLSHVLQIGEDYAEEKRVDGKQLLQQRLVFDMFSLIKQVQVTCDHSCLGAARLAGVEPKRFDNPENSFQELYQRIESAIAHLESFDPADIDGSDEREIVIRLHGQDVHFTGMSYLFNHSLPNVFFHYAAAYNILRSQGAPVGKHEFLGLIL